MTDILNSLLSNDGLAIAEQIKNEEFTAHEVVETCLQHIHNVNPKLNAVTYFAPEELIAKQLENLDSNAPFAGVPLLLKDLGIYWQEMPTTHGSYAYKDYHPDFTSELLHRFQKAGFIIIGKTSVPELGMSFVTESNLHGPCRNPWDLTRTPGGSSGGAAAALASGMGPITHASDGGGSIRVPAACCGLIGLKPTRARIPCGPVVGESWSGLSTSFVLTKSVRDTAALLDCLSGPEIGDPYAAPHNENSWALSIKTPLKQKLRIAYSTQLFDEIPVEKPCQQAVMHTLDILKTLGHKIEEVRPTFDPMLMNRAFHIITSANLNMNLKMREHIRKVKLRENELEKMTWKIFQEAEQYKASDYAWALFIMHNQSRGIARFFETFDVFVTPTTATLPVEIGHFNNERFENLNSYNLAMAKFAPFTAIWNQTGQPAISLPCYWTEKNLPVGVQFVGKIGAEDVLLQIAQELEPLLWASNDNKTRYLKNITQLKTGSPIN